MKRPLLAVLALTMVLASCGSARNSRFNPMNWFGGSQSEPTLGEISAAIDNRALASQVTQMALERTPTGAIVRAEGLMPTQGWWDAELVPESRRPVDGVMTYRFVVAAPRGAARVSTQQSRLVTAAAILSNADLELIDQVVVIGAQNTRRARR